MGDERLSTAFSVLAFFGGSGTSRKSVTLTFSAGLFSRSLLSFSELLDLLLLLLDDELDEDFESCLVNVALGPGTFTSTSFEVR